VHSHGAVRHLGTSHAQSSCNCRGSVRSPLSPQFFRRTYAQSRLSGRRLPWRTLDTLTVGAPPGKTPTRLIAQRRRHAGMRAANKIAMTGVTAHGPLLMALSDVGLPRVRPTYKPGRPQCQTMNICASKSQAAFTRSADRSTCFTGSPPEALKLVCQHFCQRSTAGTKPDRVTM